MTKVTLNHGSIMYRTSIIWCRVTLIVVHFLLVISLGGCIEEPPSLNRDPTEQEDLDQIVEVSGAETPNDIDERIGFVPELDRDVQLDDMQSEEDQGGTEASLDQGVVMEDGNEEIEEGTDEGVEDIEDWPALDLPLPEIEEERCDGIDNDLDALTDEGVSNPCGGCTPLNEDVGCVSWRVNLTQAQISSDQSSLDPRPEVQAGELDPQRLVTLSGSISTYESFVIEDARCERYRAPQSWEGAQSFGDTTLDTPRASLTLVPNPAQPGRYRALGENDTFTLHLPRDQIDIRWEGWSNPSSALPQPVIEPGSLSLRSPELVRLASDDELRNVIEAVQRPEDALALPEPISIRWVAEPQDQVAGPPLSLYIGGSQSLSRNGPYQEIRHYLMAAQLFDDGRLDFDLPSAFRAPGSSIWVYLERVHQAHAIQGQNPIVLKAGHRTERRTGSSGGSPSLPVALELLSPPINEPEPDVISEGLNVRWRLTNPDKPPERVVVSLILYDTIWTEQIACLVDDPNVGAITLPPSRLEFWPEGPQSVRQLTVRTDTKSLALSYPDRGLLRRSDSVILRLSELE